MFNKKDKKDKNELNSIVFFILEFKTVIKI